MIKRYTLLQWITIIGFSASVIGYIVHLENIHVQDEVSRNNAIKQRDATISVLRAHDVQISELKASFSSHNAKDAANKTDFDIRMDATETGLKVLETRFNDFLYYKSKK
jgi:hypothetical protein